MNPIPAEIEKLKRVMSKAAIPPQRQRVSIQQYQTSIPCIGKQDEKNNKDDDNADRNHLRQTLSSTLLVFKILRSTSKVYPSGKCTAAFTFF